MSNRVEFEFAGETVSVSYEEAAEIRDRIWKGMKAMVAECEVCAGRLTPHATCGRCRSNPAERPVRRG